MHRSNEAKLEEGAINVLLFDGKVGNVVDVTVSHRRDS